MNAATLKQIAAAKVTVTKERHVWISNHICKALLRYFLPIVEMVSTDDFYQYLRKIGRSKILKSASLYS